MVRIVEKNKDYREKVTATWTKERKAAMSLASKNLKKSAETIAKLKTYTGEKNSRHGVKLSEEIKLKMSLAQKGKKERKEFSKNQSFAMRLRFPMKAQNSVQML